MEPKEKEFKPGLATDASGGPVVDPTANVIALNDAANKRQDDLRAASDRREDDLRHAYEKLQDTRIRHLEDMAELRAAHEKELSEKEVGRINAIRAVDQLAVSTTAQQALTAIQTLAATTARDAETLRNALANTATTIAAQTASTVGDLVKRISALEQSSYEGKGRAAFADPAMTDLVTEMKGVLSARSQGTGKSEGISASWAVLIGVATLIVALIAIGGFVFNRSSTPSPPQVIYAVPPIAPSK